VGLIIKYLFIYKVAVKEVFDNQTHSYFTNKEVSDNQTHSYFTNKEYLIKKKHSYFT
jgi:hypothetical protein